jgi:MoxR-like ATPase
MTKFISVLRPLGIVGYDAVEPAIVAALATEEPLLLVSDHGAAKTLLLLRIAEALGLSVRHYNASLLQFDDLAGFPIPDEKGGIRYAAAPGAIWGAEVVFVDEIGRCRPETANKLFPIIHEKKIQGVQLDSLRYRWAATNPPPEAAGAESSDNPYEGVEVLDPALADRFSYVVRLPVFSELSDGDRGDVIRGVGSVVLPGADEQLREAVETTRRLIPTIAAELSDGLVNYVLALLPRLARAQITVGGRRAATLARNLTAVFAAHLVLGRLAGEDAFSDALCHSIPDIVRRNIAQSTLLSAHKSAWEAVALPKSDPRRILRGVADPIERALLSVTLPRVSPEVRGEALCGALAAAKKHEAEIVGWLLLPRLLKGDLVPATAIETVGEIVSKVAGGGHSVRGFGTTNEWIRNARSEIALSSLEQESADYLFNVIVRSSAPSGQLSAGAGDRSWKDPVRDCLVVWERCERALGVKPVGATSGRRAA